MKLLASHCVFPTPDICRTAEYYHDKLGFRRVDYLDSQEKHICLYRDGQLPQHARSGRAAHGDHRQRV